MFQTGDSETREGNEEEKASGWSLYYLFGAVFSIAFPILVIVANHFIAPPLREVYKKIDRTLPPVPSHVFSLTDLFSAYPILYVLTLIPAVVWWYIRSSKLGVRVFAIVMGLVDVLFLLGYVLTLYWGLLNSVQSVS